MATPINNFLLSLAVAVAQRAGLAFATAGQTAARSLWLSEIGSGAADPSTSLRCYEGAAPTELVKTNFVSIQQFTRGSSEPAVREQAWAIMEAMLNDDGTVQTGWTIAGYQLGQGGAAEADPDRDWEVVVAMPLQTPGVIGRSDIDQKFEASGNWDVEFREVGK